MDQSPFGKLAPELRNRIYELVLVEPDGIIIKSRRHRRPSVTPAVSCSLAAVCRQTRQECLPIFWGANRFTVHMSYFDCFWFVSGDANLKQMKMIHDWIDSIGPGNLQLMKHFIIDLGEAGDDPTAWQRIHNMLDGLKVPEHAQYLELCDKTDGMVLDPHCTEHQRVDYKFPVHDKIKARAICAQTVDTAVKEKPVNYTRLVAWNTKICKLMLQ